MSTQVPADWQALLQTLQEKRLAGQAMGGEEKLQKRQAKGQANARELLQLFADPGSFQELGTLAGAVSWHGLPAAPADALVCGSCSIDGRRVFIGIEDFTVQGGSIGPATNAKRVRLARLALQERTPLIMLLDGAGERASNALSRHAYAPNDMQILAELSGKVPTAAIVTGSSAGHGAITALLMDIVIMLDDASMFAAGPPLVQAATGEVCTKEQLGGADIHCRQSGVAQYRASDYADARSQLSRYLSYLPANAWAYPDQSENVRKKSVEALLDIVPADNALPYDMRKVLTLLCDDDSVFYHHDEYGRSILCAWARLGGHSVAIVANQPNIMAGAITADAADKAARFLAIANAFHVPAIFLADNPGILSGSKAEQEGTLRSAARLYAAQAALTSPKLHVTLRKAYGFGSSVMAMNPFDQQTLTLAWPGISLGGMPAHGGAEAAGMDDEEARRLAAAQASGAWNCGDTLAYDEIIDPRETREVLLRGLELALNRRLEAATPVLRNTISP
jgi:acetyl-CoA carboxylase carboxyltransferase component